MVVAEIPLWVVHSSSTPETNPVSRLSQNTTDAAAQEALESYYLSSSTTVKQKSTKKTAIYSIDSYQDLFVTGGGDGTIRIWNMNALFVLNGNNHHPKEGDSNKKAPSAHYDAITGAYVSSESSQYDENSHESGNSSSNHESEMGHQPTLEEKVVMAQSTTEIHDLNAHVRSKKSMGTIGTTGSGTTGSSNNNIPSSPQKTTTTPIATPSHRPVSVTSSSSPRLLGTVAAHSGSSVLCVRFSHSGQSIASAGDDGCVCIYQQQQQVTPLRLDDPPGTTAATTWVRIRLCRGHDLDVVDLAWSPDDYYLVSCSLDSNTPIIVWKMNDLQQSVSSSRSGNSMICHPYKILGKNIHTSTVKGIAFDPAGSYLASSGDDPAICIWRTHDDWGLITRIDHQSGIFRTWKQQNDGGDNHARNNNNDDDIQALSSQSLFRRISWSTDGAFLCSTNSVVKNKHVASTISREKWQVSGGGSGHNTSTTGTAANLVGHKQPIVVSRHASHLLHVKKKKPAGENDDENDDDGSVPEYATLLALGDRRGFVTVWSTRKSRPLFKIQCSESHCTVTDLAWGRQSSKGDMILLVTLLEGLVVAFKFAIPDELGYVLSSKEQARVFQVRYGIDIDEDMNDESFIGGRRRQILETSGPNLIENALQMSLEENMKKSVDDDNDDIVMNDDNDDDDIIVPPSTHQHETRTISGKKRIRPVLVQMSTGSGHSTAKQKKTSSSQAPPKASLNSSTPATSNVDPLQSVMAAAERVSAAAERSNSSSTGRSHTNNAATNTAASTNGSMLQQERERSATMMKSNHLRSTPIPQPSAALSYSTSRSHSIDLPVLVARDPFFPESTSATVTVECVNVTKVPLGSKGGAIPCIDITIASKGAVMWKDQIVGTFCSAVSASSKIFVIGTTDGTIQMYSTSPSIGWTCGNAFRSHPALIIGTSIVSVQLLDSSEQLCESRTTTAEIVTMLVVSADGGFGVWTVIPTLQIQYKGTVLPILTHMSCATDNRLFPRLARMNITDTGRLVAILSLDLSDVENQDTSVDYLRSSHPQNIAGSGGSLQAFVYDTKSELWIRIADSRFVLSDFYTALPSSKLTNMQGVLSKIDDAVRLGSFQSSLKAGQRSRIIDRYVNGIYEQAEDDTCNFIASRSHCEDRLACALAMNSQSEFKHWLKNYVRILVIKGQSSPLRIFIDMLLQQKEGRCETDSNLHRACWWLSGGTKLFNEDRFLLVKNLVIPEMSKSRTLQRLTNEVSLEVDTIEKAVTEQVN